MRSLTPAALIFSAAALLAAAPPLAAQETRPAPAAKNLALEIDGEPEYDYPIHAKGMMEASPRRRLPGFEQPAGAPPLTAVRIDTDFEGEAVRINLSVVFDDSHLADAPGPKYGRKVQAVASYLAREGESVRLEELARFGVEPMTLRVVKAKPRQEPAALTTAPLAANDLKAVQIVGFEPAEPSPANRNYYRLRLQNISQKAITALSLYEEGGGGRSSMIMQGSAARPLIAPGDVYQTNFHFNVGGRTTPQGYVHDADRQRTLTVGTLVFDDGTYEGEADAAALIFAGRRGGEIQNARILPLLRALLAAPPPDVAAALEKLKLDVESLRVDADPAAVAELLAQHPSLARGVAEKHAERGIVKGLSLHMMSGLKDGRETVLHTIKRWEEERARAPETFDLRRRVSGLVEQLEQGGRR